MPQREWWWCNQLYCSRFIGGKIQEVPSACGEGLQAKVSVTVRLVSGLHIEPTWSDGRWPWKAPLCSMKKQKVWVVLECGGGTLETPPHPPVLSFLHYFWEGNSSMWGRIIKAQVSLQLRKRVKNSNASPVLSRLEVDYKPCHGYSPARPRWWDGWK